MISRLNWDSILRLYHRFLSIEWKFWKLGFTCELFNKSTKQNQFMKNDLTHACFNHFYWVEFDSIWNLRKLGLFDVRKFVARDGE